MSRARNRRNGGVRKDVPTTTTSSKSVSPHQSTKDSHSDDVRFPLGPLHRLLLRYRERGVSAIVKLQSLRTSSLDILMAAVSMVHEELGYIALLPGMFWVMDECYGTHLAILVSSNICFGNYLKNLLLIPRPPSPPVWRYTHDDDYGTPSTHTMNGISMGLFFAWLLSGGSGPYLSFALSCGISWAILVGISRVYLGAHNIIDVLAAFVYSPLLLYAYVFMGGRMLINTVVQSPSYGALAAVPITIGIIYFHPRPPKVNEGVPESSMMMGCVAAVILHVWSTRFYRGYFPAIDAPWVHMDYTQSLTCRIALRVVVGAIIAYITRAVAKGGSTSLLRWWKLRSKKDKMLSAEEKHDIKVIVKYITYFSIGTTVTTLTNWFFFPALGISLEWREPGVSPGGMVTCYTDCVPPLGIKGTWCQSW